MAVARLGPGSSSSSSLEENGRNRRPAVRGGGSEDIGCCRGGVSKLRFMSGVGDLCEDLLPGDDVGGSAEGGDCTIRFSGGVVILREREMVVRGGLETLEKELKTYVDKCVSRASKAATTLEVVNFCISPSCCLFRRNFTIRDLPFTVTPFHSRMAFEASWS